MNKDAEILIKIRSERDSDTSFIMATWLRGLYYGNTWFREIDKDIFMDTYHQAITVLLKKSTTEVKVAVLKDDPEVILGYSVLDQGHPNTVLHWVFIKEAWRKMGIARALIPTDTDTCTHLTVVGRKLKPINMKFNPFLL